MQTDRKTEILDAFMRLVSQYGIDKTTMQDIAREAEINVALIYKDFRNKEDLVEAYIYRKIQQIMVECEQIQKQDLPPEQLLHEFISGLFRVIQSSVLQDKGFWQFVRDENTIKYLRRMIHKKDSFLQANIKMIEEIMARGVREGVFEIEDLHETAELFLDAFHKYFGMMFKCRTEADLFSGIDKMYALLIKGIRKKAPAARV
ncbi:MAG TPA: TetR/AcrR family transcriptional regulator [Bacillota bacterium]